MMKHKFLFVGLFGLAALAAPVSVADTVAGTPDATVHYESNTVGEAIAALPLLNDVVPSTAARYYVYLCSAGWCAPCNREMPHVVDAYREMKRSGKVEMLMLNYDRDEADAHAFLEKYGVMFPVTKSVNAPQLPGFVHPRGIPFAIIVDGEGHVVTKGSASLLREWKKHIATYEQEQGKSQSFPESLTLELTPCHILADTDMPEDDAAAADKDSSAASVVAEALQNIAWFNGEPNLKAEYYIYLQSASWCGPCRKEMPAIAKEYKAMKRSGRVELVLLSGDRTEAAAKEFLKKNKAKFPAVLGSDGAVRALPGAGSLPNYYPAAVILSADGTVIKAGHGSIIENWRKLTIGAKK